jgi:NitT/TauT family transport system substrate-binding protein
MTHSRSRRVCGAALLLCASIMALAVPRAAQADDTLTIMGGNALPGLYGVLEIVANRAGFFKQEHIDFQEQYVSSPSLAAQLVGIGKGDLASITAEAVIQGYDKGLKLEYFFAHAARFSNVLAVPDDSPIHTLADFKGKNIGEINAGSAGEVLAQVMLGGAGLKKGDYSFSPIGLGPQALEALIDKKVDAVAYPYAEVVPMEVVGNIKMRVFRDPILQDIPNAGLASTPATIAAKGDLLKRFARAMVKASLFVRYNPAATAHFFIEAGGGGGKLTPQALALETRELTLLEDDLPAADPLNKHIGAFPLTGLQIISQTLFDYGKTSAVVPATSIATNAFVAFANDFDHRAVIAYAKAYVPGSSP